MERLANYEGMKKPYRKHTCWDCGYSWLAPVRFGKVGEMINLGNEKTEFCSVCGKPSSMSTAWLDMFGEDYYKEDN